MANVLNAAKTMRNLKRGANGAAPYAYFTAGQRLLQFFAAANDQSTPWVIDIKPGATFYHDGYKALVTIQGGSGNSYLCDQAFVMTSAGIDQWYLSQTTNDKGRNSSGVPATNDIVAGLLVPDAVHYIYASVLDDAGAADYYVYVDTLQPERGVHPYTRDVAIGSFKTPPITVTISKNTGRIIMDLQTRMRNLEGAARTGRSAGTTSQDYRLAQLIQRFYNLEVWANSAGHFGTPPAVGSNATYVEDDFIQAGDPSS